MMSFINEIIRNYFGYILLLCVVLFFIIKWGIENRYKFKKTNKGEIMKCKTEEELSGDKLLQDLFESPKSKSEEKEKKSFFSKKSDSDIKLSKREEEMPLPITPGLDDLGMPFNLKNMLNQQYKKAIEQCEKIQNESKLLLQEDRDIDKEYECSKSELDKRKAELNNKYKLWYMHLKHVSQMIELHKKDSINMEE